MKYVIQPEKHQCGGKLDNFLQSYYPSQKSPNPNRIFPYVILCQVRKVVFAKVKPGEG